MEETTNQTATSNDAPATKKVSVYICSPGEWNLVVGALAKCPAGLISDAFMLVRDKKESEISVIESK